MLLPKLVTTLQDYDRRQFMADVTAGVIVGIVALPLAIAFAIASGVTPDRGLWTAIIAGFLISALGGSRVQIGGPTGAFIVVVYGVIQQHGYDGLLLATLTKDDERVTLQVLGDGPLGGVTVDANGSGTARAYVKHPGAGAIAPAGDPRNPRPSLADAVGRSGVVSVIRDVGLRENFSGTTAIGNDSLPGPNISPVTAAPADVAHHSAAQVSCWIVPAAQGTASLRSW